MGQRGQEPRESPGNGTGIIPAYCIGHEGTFNRDEQGDIFQGVTSFHYYLYVLPMNVKCVLKGIEYPGTDCEHCADNDSFNAA
ncbi:hypothetical protein D3C72_2225770 [compost metagenome]